MNNTLSCGALLAILALPVIGCGSQAEPESPKLTEVQAAKFDMVLQNTRKIRDLQASLGSLSSTNDADKSDLRQHVQSLDVWIRDFERAQDARDDAAMRRRMQELQPIMEKVRKFKLNDVRP